MQSETQEYAVLNIELKKGTIAEIILYGPDQMHFNVEHLEFHGEFLHVRADFRFSDRGQWKLLGSHIKCNRASGAPYTKAFFEESLSAFLEGEINHSVRGQKQFEASRTWLARTKVA